MLQHVSDLVGHQEDRVWHAAWSNNGKFISSCGTDKVVRVWGCRTGLFDINHMQCVATLEDAQSRTIRCCEWSKNDLAIACASFDGTVAIWEAQNESRTSWEMVILLNLSCNIFLVK